MGLAKEVIFEHHSGYGFLISTSVKTGLTKIQQVQLLNEIERVIWVGTNFINVRFINNICLNNMLSFFKLR